VRVGEDPSLLLRVADRIRRILYRPDCVTAYRFPEGDAVSLTYSAIEDELAPAAGLEVSPW
jgi:hypothetical protein